jgi:multiple sugar transport system ATP-binding protein
MVFQRPALYPHLTVRGNLEFSRKLLHPWHWLARLAWRWLWPERFRRLDTEDASWQEKLGATARILGLTEVLDRFPHQLSGGQQQRVALGRALLRQAEVYMLDEPLGHLDESVRLDLRRQLHLLHRQLPATMLYVTHDPQEALALADRLAVLDQGVVQQVGPPDKVFDEPANRRVAEIVASRVGPMNFLEGRLGEEEGLALRGLEGSLPVPSRVADRWRAFAGRPVTVGIRPEDLRVENQGVEDKKNEPGLLSLEAFLIEFQGGNCVVSGSALGWRLAAVAERHGSVDRGQQVTLTMNWDKAILFDGSSGRALAFG